MIWWAALLLWQQQIYQLPEVQNNPHTTAADIEQGKKLYAGRCAGCHGPGGDGGKGANLAVPVLPRAVSDRSLYQVVRYGIPDTEMPASLMAPREVWQIAAFVRTLGKVRNEPINGDAGRGGQLVRGKGGCLQCHAIGTEGGRMGPALTDIGARRGPGHLRTKLMDASSDVPETFRLVDVRTRDGRQITGIRLNEDTWSIQLRDFSDKFHSLAKEDLASLQSERRTPMPSYKQRLDSNELNDIVAYLAGLRGAQ